MTSGKTRYMAMPQPKQDFCLVLLLLVLTAALGWPVADAPWVLDDLTQVRYVESFSGLWDWFGVDSLGLFRPVKNLLFLTFVDGRGLGSTGWSLFGLGLHLLNGLLLGLLLRRLGQSPGVAWLAALVWALSPAGPAVFAFYSAHNVALCTVALLGYLHILLQPPKSERAFLLLGLAAHGLLALALLCYELAVVAPFMLAMLQAYRTDWRLGWPSRKLLRLLLPACVLVLAYLGLRALFSEVWSGRLPTFAPDSPKWALTASAPRYALWHIGVFFDIVPWGIMLTDKPLAHFGLNLSFWLAGAALLLLLWHHRARLPGLVLGIGLALGALVPLVNLLPLGNGPYAVYYAYLPGTGLAMALGFALQYSPLPRLGQYLALGAFALYLAAGTPARVRAWADTDLLFAQTAKHYPQAWTCLAHQLGQAMQAEDFARAADIWHACEAIAPWNATARLLAHHLYLETGQQQQALEVLTQLPPQAEITHRLLYQRALMWQQMGQRAEAKADFQAILSLPVDRELTPEALNSLAIILVAEARLPEAIKLWERAQAIAPDNVGIRQNLAHARQLAH